MDWLLTIVLIVGFGASGLYGIYQYLFSHDKPTTANQVKLVAPPHRDVLLMNAVQKVNTQISMLMVSPYSSLGLDEPVPCMVAKSLSEGSNHNDVIVVKLIAELTGQCAFSRLVKDTTFPIFENIAATRLLPAKLVTFGAFHEDRWVEVGLFDSDDSCNSIREEALRHGIGTKACGLWQVHY